MYPIKEKIPLTDLQKYCLGFSVISIFMLLIAMFDVSAAYYVFLRILVCGTLVLLCFCNLYAFWWKIVLILNAIVYNPFVQINLNQKKHVYQRRGGMSELVSVFDSSDWIALNIVAIIVVLISGIYILKKRKDAEKKKAKEDFIKEVRENTKDIWITAGNMRFNVSLEKDKDNGTPSTR